MDETKDSIRQKMRRRRRALSSAVVDAAAVVVARSVCELEVFRRAPVLLAYAATDGEVSADAVMAAAFAAGKRVFLPRLAGDRMLFAEHRSGRPLAPGAFGIPEPTGEPLEAGDAGAAVALVPLLAWDPFGSRLGRGGGHYDRAVADGPRPAWLIGLGYAFQRCAALPREPWDLRLDYVVTEDEVVRCGRGDERSPRGKEGTNDNDIRVDGAARRRAGRRADMGGRLPPAPTR